VGCARALGDIIPSRVFVAPDRSTARLWQRVEDLALELRQARWRLRSLRSATRQLQTAQAEAVPSSAAERLDRLSASVRDLERRLERTEAPRGADRGVPWLGALGTAAAALALGWAIGRRRRRDLAPVPDDLRSLDHERGQALAGRR
jgi:AcrR family transcriptional regulator